MALMAQELIVLGTGNAMVTRCFNTCFALRFGQEYFLIDSGGGNGILRVLADADILPSDIHHLFITHAHTDHILGVPWLVRSIGTQMLANRYDGTLTIYCHDVAEQAIRTICELTIQKKFNKLFDDRIQFVTLN
ncbi:MAG TPA: MBL fold metallo-hydrolase, partial [Clostridia bacterium]|nr:MBL fold metallo-hydrolase [Clostridia bacterium]